MRAELDGAGAAAAAPPDGAALQRVGAVAIDLCASVGRLDLLYGPIYQRFRRTAASSHALRMGSEASSRCFWVSTV